MSKYIVKNCPCYWHIGEDDGCSLENLKNCEDDDNCIMKQVVRLCEKNQFFNYGAVMLGNGLSVDILDLLGIEEVNENL